MLEVKIALEDLRDALQGGAVPGISPRPTMAKHRRWLAGSLIGLASLFAVTGFWLLINQIIDHSGRNGGLPEIARLTNEGGLNIDPAISPDGKLLAYASDHGGDGNMDIWVKQIGGDSIRVTRDRADDVEPNFSPDGTRIVFRSAREGGGIYLMPTLGGTEQRLADGGRRPQFSPDGSKIAYWTGPENPFPLRKGMGQIFVFDLATSTVRQLREDFAAAVHPVWSPDGKNILFIGLKDAADVAHTYDWWITAVTGGTAVQCHMLTGNGDFDPFAWRGNRVYFSEQLLNSPRTRAGVVTIVSRTWQVAGRPLPLTFGTTNEESPSLSKDGRLVFASLIGNRSLYELPVEANLGRAAGPVQRLTSNEADNIARSISADGKRVAFVSTRTGSEEIWVRDLAAGPDRELTFDGQGKMSPLITRGGEWVAWKLNDMEDHRTFATPFAGGAPTLICADCGVPDAWSGDGKFLLFAQRKSGRMFVGLLDVAAGAGAEYMQDPQVGLRVSSISEDGKWIAFAAFTTDRDFAMYVAPFSPFRPPPRSEWIRIAHSARAHPNPRWSPDGNMLYFSSEQDGYACIWAERLDPATKHPRGEPFAVQHFHSTSLKMVEPSFWDPIALAADRIVLSLQSRSGEIWMLKLKD
jgi:Tol biopolymer transport system component